ncbi:MAG: hypothetical protein E6H52_18530 [Betaproteobacteria bacterium]|nr:MAG: hypothetical protein E6H52_18530 [Betaproteobacteria bacterium]
MSGKPVGTALAPPLCAILATIVFAAPAVAQNEQFIPALVYRTGAYSPNGVPLANGIADYYKLINARDGGINGVKIVTEECEFSYATDRGVECYERLKHNGPTGAAYVNPLSTGVTFALTDRTTADKIPVVSPGYGRSESRDGSVFQWNFPLLGTWGVMNSTAIKEAVAVGYPREKMYGVWWSGAEPDVRPAGDGAKGYNAVTLQHTSGRFKLHEDLKKYVYDKGQGSAQWERTGEILYVRGLITSMLGVEAIRTAQAKFGNKPLTGEQVRWGYENLDISADRIKQLGFEGVLRPIKVSCADHEGAHTGRIQTWDGENWKITSDWYVSDDSVIAPMVKEAAARYATEKKIATGCL